MQESSARAVSQSITVSVRVATVMEALTLVVMGAERGLLGEVDHRTEKGEPVLWRRVEEE